VLPSNEKPPIQPTPKGGWKERRASVGIGARILRVRVCIMADADMSA